ncbi:MAG: DUF4254 domain-containing protein [Saprospiraceae bacterium]
MISAEYCSSLFLSCIEQYHMTDDVNVVCPILSSDSIHDILINKVWIDTIQWHLEDIMRRPELEVGIFIETKRRIDLLNQERTDLVERIDDWFMNQFKDVILIENPRLNTETPAWVIDRLSILMLKIYHMNEQTQRLDAGEEHLKLCNKKLETLLAQKLDLSFSLNTFLTELGTGIAQMKVYRQMKMYNDPSTNPELYQKKFS